MKRPSYRTALLGCTALVGWPWFAPLVRTRRQYSGPLTAPEMREAIAT